MVGQITAFDDVFVVKYDARAQQGLLEHVDAGELSFMVALSDSSDFDGGGTYFQGLERTLCCDKGDILTFHAKLYHRGTSMTLVLVNSIAPLCLCREMTATQAAGEVFLPCQSSDG